MSTIPVHDQTLAPIGACTCPLCTKAGRAWTTNKYVVHPVVQPTPGLHFTPIKRCEEYEQELKAHPEYEPGIPTFREWQLRLPGKCACRQCEIARRAEPELVERELTCPTCRRLFCKVRAPIAAKIEVVCEGCILEGRT